MPIGAVPRTQVRRFAVGHMGRMLGRLFWWRTLALTWCVARGSRTGCAVRIARRGRHVQHATMRFELLRQNGTLGLVRCVVRDGRAGTGNRGAPQTTGRRRCLSRGTKKTVQHGTLPDTRADTDTDTADRRTHTSAAHDDTDCIAHATGTIAFTANAIANTASDPLADIRTDCYTDTMADTSSTALCACTVGGMGALQCCLWRRSASAHA